MLTVGHIIGKSHKPPESPLNDESTFIDVPYIYYGILFILEEDEGEDGEKRGVREGSCVAKLGSS